MGTFFLVVKPYKKQWMNIVDGLILDLVGVLVLCATFVYRQAFIVAVVTSITVLFILCLAGLCKHLRKKTWS